MNSHPLSLPTPLVTAPPKTGAGPSPTTGDARGTLVGTGEGGAGGVAHKFTIRLHLIRPKKMFLNTDYIDQVWGGGVDILYCHLMMEFMRTSSQLPFPSQLVNNIQGDHAT